MVLEALSHTTFSVVLSSIAFLLLKVQYKNTLLKITSATKVSHKQGKGRRACSSAAGVAEDITASRPRSPTL